MGGFSQKMVSNGSRRTIKANQNPSFLTQAGEQFSYIYAKIYNTLRPKPALVGKKKRPLNPNNTPKRTDFDYKSLPNDLENAGDDFFKPSSSSVTNTPEARKLKELESKIDWLVGQQVSKFGGFGDDNVLINLPTKSPESRQEGDDGSQKFQKGTAKDIAVVQLQKDLKSKSPLCESNSKKSVSATRVNLSKPVRSRSLMDALIAEMKNHKLKKTTTQTKATDSGHLKTALQSRFAQMEKENEW